MPVFFSPSWSPFLLLKLFTKPFSVMCLCYVGRGRGVYILILPFIRNIFKPEN